MRQRNFSGAAPLYQVMQPPESGKHRIFLAEDNPADVFLVQEALNRWSIKFDLIMVPDGERALQYLDALDKDPSQPFPALAILDLNLPRASGEQVLRRIRQSPRFGSMPVIVLTSSEAPRDRASASALGASIYFPKSNDLDEFLVLGGVIQKLLAGEWEPDCV